MNALKVDLVNLRHGRSEHENYSQNEDEFEIEGEKIHRYHEERMRHKEYVIGSSS